MTTLAPSISLLRFIFVISQALAIAFITTRPHSPSSATMKVVSSSIEENESEQRAVYRYASPFFFSVENKDDGAGPPLTPSALIILNTPIQSTGCSNDGKLSGVLGMLWEVSTYRTCADGGANRLYDATVTLGSEDGKNNYLPNLITGDLDSLRRDVRQYYESKGVEIIRVEDQDYHDLDVRRCVFARLCCFNVYSTLFIFYNNRSH